MTFWGVFVWGAFTPVPSNVGCLDLDTKCSFVTTSSSHIKPSLSHHLLWNGTKTRHELLHSFLHSWWICSMPTISPAMVVTKWRCIRGILASIGFHCSYGSMATTMAMVRCSDGLDHPYYWCWYSICFPWWAFVGNESFGLLFFCFGFGLLPPTNNLHGNGGVVIIASCLLILLLLSWSSLLSSMSGELPINILLATWHMPPCVKMLLSCMVGGSKASSIAIVVDVVVSNKWMVVNFFTWTNNYKSKTGLLSSQWRLVPAQFWCYACQNRWRSHPNKEPLSMNTYVIKQSIWHLQNGHPCTVQCGSHL